MAMSSAAQVGIRGIARNLAFQICTIEPNTGGVRNALRRFRVFPDQSAFPYSQNPPALISQKVYIACVTLPICSKLGGPEIASRLWNRRPIATVGMPITTVNEDDRIEPRKDDVGTSRQIIVMEPISQSYLVKGSSEQNLRFGVLRPDPPHYT